MTPHQNPEPAAKAELPLTAKCRQCRDGEWSVAFEGPDGFYTSIHPLSEGQAQFIVQAVNCHDELVAALREIERRALPCKRLGAALENVRGMARDAASKAEAALAARKAVAK